MTVLAAETDLLGAARRGSAEAFAELYRLHEPAATRFAIWLAGANDAQDLVAEAFAKTWSALQNGHGPETAFNAYVLAAVRSSNVDRLRRSGCEVAVADHEVLPAFPTQPDGTAERAEADAVLSAFRSLPRRWQTVLWRTEVGCESLADVGAELRMNVNAVAALGHRAREGLRRAYLAQHQERRTAPGCAAFVDHLPQYVRGGLRGSQRDRLQQHLEDCVGCAVAAADLTAISCRLRATLAPLFLAVGIVSPPVAGLLTGLAGLAARAKALLSSWAGAVASVPQTVVAGAAATTAAGAVAVVVSGAAVSPPAPAHVDRSGPATISVADPAPRTPTRSTARPPAARAPTAAPSTAVPPPTQGRVAPVAAVVTKGSAHPAPAVATSEPAAPVVAPTPSPTPVPTPVSVPSTTSPAGPTEVSPAPSSCSTASSSTSTATSTTTRTTMTCSQTYVFEQPLAHA